MDDESLPDTQKMKKRRKLKNMGPMAALAIGLHNFPERLATFVPAIVDPAVGIALTRGYCNS